MNSAFLEIKNLVCGRNTPLTNAFNSQVNKGEFIILSGINGSGKSTLLKTISGIIPGISGEIIIDAQHKFPLNIKKLSHLISFAGTSRVYEDYISVEDLVRFGRFPFTNYVYAGENDAYIDAALEKMGIAHIRSKYLDHISDGEWQKANIARVIVQNTPLILMDEPSAFLDYPSRIRMFSDLKRLCETENKIVILSTHDIDVANKYGTLFWHIDNLIIKESRVSPDWNL